jgi:PiT family inorganic phosphate transporter
MDRRVVAQLAVGRVGVVAPAAVRWGVAGRIVWAWVLTIPGSALIGALTYYALRAGGAA